MRQREQFFSGRMILILGVAGASLMFLLPDTGRTSSLPASRDDDSACLIAPQIAWFLAPGVEREALPPSFALVKPAECSAPLPNEWTLRPNFRALSDRYSASLQIEPGTSLYGVGEPAGALLRNGRVVVTWNTGAFAYTARTKSFYQSHPWVFALRADGSAFGVLADTTYKLTIDLRRGINFTSEGHPFPVIVIEAASPGKLMEKLASLIGTISLPPRWALGYHQCRYSYYPEARARQIADEFRARRLPCDVIWFDIHYMDGYRVFTFSPEYYPDPKRMNDYLHERGFKSVWIIDPGVKKEPGYWVYDQGTAGAHWVLDQRGREFNARVWPGICAFPDFTRPETRDWWASLHQDFLATGIDGIWNDMNEPSFIQFPTTMPKSNFHRGGGGLPPGDHALYHNVYGMLMVMATHQGMLRARPERRPFILSRANFIGGQRYAAGWSGDNYSNWENVKFSVTMILNMGLSGQSFFGPDIGGHIGPGTPEMFARWFGVGMFFPFARGHTTNGNIDKEPWAFGEEVEASCRTALERRYRLLPYLYTLFWEAAQKGLPVMRPVFFADPTDPALRTEDNAFLLGTDLLVLPLLDKDANYQHRLPKGIWRRITLVGEDPEVDINQPELRLRGGAILPLGRVIQNTTEESLAPLTLMLSLDEEGRAEGWLYEDEGDGWAYQRGWYLRTRYTARQEGERVIVQIAEQEGNMPRPEREVVVEVVTDQGIKRTSGKETSPLMIELSAR